MLIRMFVSVVVSMFVAGPLLSAEGELEHAAAMFEAGDLDGARTALETVIATDTENHAAYYQLGRVSLAQSELDRAIDLLKKAVDLKEENSTYRTWLGRAYIQKLQTVSFFEKGMLSGKALDQLKKAVKLDPANVEARISLAGYYLNAPSIAGGSKKKAREQAEEILKYDPVEGNAILAGIHLKDKEYDLAIEKLEQCIASRPEEIAYRYRLGMIHQELEQHEPAFAIFEQALAIEPDATAVLYQMGRTAAFSGAGVDRGIACLEKYLTLPVAPGYPGYDAAHWRLGMLYEHKGDQARARLEYEAALQLNPEGEDYQESLAALAKD